MPGSGLSTGGHGYERAWSLPRRKLLKSAASSSASSHMTHSASRLIPVHRHGGLGSGVRPQASGASAGGWGGGHPLIEGPRQAVEKGKGRGKGEKPSARPTPPSSQAGSTWCPLPALSKVLPDTGQKRGWGDGFQGQALGLESSQTQSHTPVVRAHLGHRQSPWEALGPWSDWFP